MDEVIFEEFEYQHGTAPLASARRAPHLPAIDLNASGTPAARSCLRPRLRIMGLPRPGHHLDRQQGLEAGLDKLKKSNEFLMLIRRRRPPVIGGVDAGRAASRSPPFS